MYKRQGYHKALFISETGKDSDYYRWMGFKQAMEKNGRFCSKSRLMVVSSKRMQRLHEYEELLPRFLEAKALAFSSDFSAIEAINFFVDHKISIPDQISVTGFDDSIYASLVLSLIHISLIFEKTSTRTRCAFEVAAHDLGMGSTYLDPSGSQIGKKESIADTARVLGRMYDGIEYRGFGQEIVEDLAKYAGVPVWNGLTNEYHPTQMLSLIHILQYY